MGPGSALVFPSSGKTYVPLPSLFKKETKKLSWLLSLWRSSSSTLWLSLISSSSLIINKQNPNTLKLLQQKQGLRPHLKEASHSFPGENHGLRHGVMIFMSATPHLAVKHSRTFWRATESALQNSPRIGTRPLASVLKEVNKQIK